jgi:hypothetical protein
MDLSLSLSRNSLTIFLVIIITWLLALGMALAIATSNLLIFALGLGGIAAAIAFLRWPSLVLAVIYPSTWVFWSYTISGIGRPERIIGLLGIAGLFIVALGPGRVRLPKVPVVIITGILFLIGAYLVSAAIHPDLRTALDYIVSLVTRVAFFYLAYAHLRTERHLRWVIVLLILAGVGSALLTLGTSLVFGFGFNREFESFSAAKETLGPLWLTVLNSSDFNTVPALFVLSLYPVSRGRAQKAGIILLALFLFAMAFAAEYRREILITVPLLLGFLVVDKTAGLRRPALWALGLSIAVFLFVFLPYSIVLQDRLEYETQFVVAGTEPRIASAFAGLQAAANSPLTGYGPGTYAQVIYPILGPGRRAFEYYAYNVFVWILVEAGIFGLLGVVLILIGTYREASKKRRTAEGIEGLVLRSAPSQLLLIVIWFMFGNAWDLSLPWFLIGVILAAARIADERRLSEAVSTV